MGIILSFFFLTLNYMLVSLNCLPTSGLIASTVSLHFYLFILDEKMNHESFLLNEGRNNHAEGRCYGGEERKQHSLNGIIAKNLNYLREAECPGSSHE